MQQLEAPGWRNIRDVLDMLPWPSFEDTQQIAMGGQLRRRGLADTKAVLSQIVKFDRIPNIFGF